MKKSSLAVKQRKSTMFSSVMLCWLALAGSQQAAWARKVGLGGQRAAAGQFGGHVRKLEDGIGGGGDITDASIINGQPATAGQFRGYVRKLLTLNSEKNGCAAFR